MKTRVIKLLWEWVPSLLWMGFIFILSDRQRIAISQTYAINFLIFKTLHVIEYAILYSLLVRSLTLSNNHSNRENLLIAFILAVIYAITDEFHQTLISSREGTPRDILIDAVGITIMYLLIKTRWSLIRRMII